MFAAAGTPRAIVGRLNGEIAKILNQPDVKEKFLNAGAEATGSSPSKLAATIKSDLAVLGEVIKGVGIQVQ